MAYAEEPDQSNLLGARWTRITNRLPESHYLNHMPEASPEAKAYCQGQTSNKPKGYNPPDSYYGNDAS